MTTQNIYALTDTWNAGGTTFKGIALNVTDTASASGSLLLDLQVGGTSQFSIRKDGATTLATKLAGGGFTLGENGSGAITVRANGLYGWANDTTGGGAYDLTLARDAADTLAQRRGTNAQAFRVYSTYTDSSNGRWMQYSNNGITLSAQGTGVSGGNDLYIANSLNRSVFFSSNNTVRWEISAAGHFLAGADNTYDIGASNATRPRNVYAAGFIDSDTSFRLSSGGTARMTLFSPSDGVLRLANGASADFGRLQFGGTTSSFPSLKRSGTELQARLADDTGDANLAAGQLKAAGGVTTGYGTAIPAGGNNGIGLKGTSTANFGVFFGSGAPTLSAAQGSLYLRSDGTTTNDRAYINTDGATTWTALTTAA